MRSKHVPQALKPKMKGPYLAVEVASLGMAINLLSSAGLGKGSLLCGVTAAFCFLVVGTVAVWLIQKIEYATSVATTSVIVAQVAGTPVFFADEYREVLSKERLAGLSNWLLSLGFVLLVVGGTLWLYSLGACS